jgi:transcriptional regulator with XRE-family HTH domain
MTQVQLAEALGIAQQTLAHYEGGKLRVAVALLPPLAQILGVGVDELIGAPVKRAGKRGPTPKLQQQVERLSQLPQAKQRMVMQMLEGFLNQAAKSG